MLTWDELNRDFNKHRPAGEPIGSTFWFKKQWTGRKSINDLLREFLNEQKIQYIHTYNGDIWFLYRGNWTKCDWVNYTDQDDREWVDFSLLEYVWN